MPHELKGTFSSTLFFKETGASAGQFRPDFLGDFDLNNISDDGNMARCTRRRVSTEPITGQATPVTSQPPFAYDVEISQTRPVRVTYRGVALRNDMGEVTRIVGHAVFQFGSDAQRRELGVDKLLPPPDQNETTWVATKP